MQRVCRIFTFADALVLPTAHCPKTSEHRGVLRVLTRIFLSCPSLKHLDAEELSRYWRYLCPKRL